MILRANVGALAAAVLLQCSAAMADEANLAADTETDWLIARRDGQWELVAKGLQGRVHKLYPNQEVLRQGVGGTFVEVVSAPAMEADEEIACSQRARRDARNLCSSSFLVCQPASGGVALSLTMFVLGATESAADHRNRLACRIDVDAVLHAAKTVGMIQRIPPQIESR